MVGSRSCAVLKSCPEMGVEVRMLVENSVHALIVKETMYPQ
jgi:hypothetical protein